MLINEFIEATSRLENYYGKEYQTIQRQIMFEELKDLSIERYKKLVSVVIRKSKFLPKVADIMEANLEEPYTSNKQDSEKTECEKCKGSGYLIYTKIIKDGNIERKNQYACICDCGNAKQYKGWEITDHKYRTNFYTPMCQELGL